MQTFAVRLQSLTAETTINVNATYNQERKVVEMCQCKEMDERLRIQFLNGINDKIKRSVMLHDPKTFEEALLVAFHEELKDQVIFKFRPYVGKIDETSAASIGSDYTNRELDSTAELQAAMQQISDRLDTLKTQPDAADNAYNEPKLDRTINTNQILIELREMIERLCGRVDRLEDTLTRHSSYFPQPRTLTNYQNNSNYNSSP